MFDTLNHDGQYCDGQVFLHFSDRILIISILVLAVIYIFLLFKTNIN